MIPQLLLEEILSGEKQAKDYYEKYGKDNLEAALSELKTSNEQILTEYPADKMEQNFVKKAVFAKNRKTKYMWIMAAAAVFAAALVLPVAVENSKSLEPQTGIRIKGSEAGHHQLHLYKKAGNSAVILKNGDMAKENDSVQIAYVPGTYNYGVIFSFDGNGNVTKHFPEYTWEAGKLSKTGEEVLLPFSYVLDDAPEYECFVFVASNEEFDMSDFGTKCDNNKVKKNHLADGFYFPKNCDGTVFILNK